MARPLRIEYPGAYYHLLRTYFGGDTTKGRRQCREYVNHAIEGKIENPFKDVVHQSILSIRCQIQRSAPSLSGHFLSKYIETDPL